MTLKQKAIIEAALHLHLIHREKGFVADYELFLNKFGLTETEMRSIRDVVQEYDRATANSE